MPNDNEEKPREKGLGEYTRDFVSGLFGRKDEEDEEKKEAAEAQADNLPLNQTALKAAEEARQRAVENAREDAEEKAREAAAERARASAEAKARNEAAHEASESLAERLRDQAAAAAASVKPQAADKDDKLDELERLRDRVRELEADPAVAQQAKPAPRTYTVVSGDSLSLIAKRYYGDPMQWKRIYEANRDKIENPDLIYPGQEFVIPE